MKFQRMWKFSGVLMAGAVIIAGCGPREEQVEVAVQQPTTVVKNTKKTEIQPVPQDKTVVVQRSPQPSQPKVETETDVKVQVEAPKQSASGQEPPPAKSPLSKSAQRPNTTATPRPKPAATPRPKPTATPRPRPVATPARTAQQNAPLVVRAEIVSTSTVPDPKNVAYKDSIVFHKYRVLSVQRGDYNEKEILIAHWAMKNKKLQPAARYRKGQVQVLRLEPLSKRPNLETLQRSDDTGEFALEPYWAVSVLDEF